jgi:hypothetical protein
MLLIRIYLLTDDHAHPDKPELNPTWIPESTVPQRNPITSNGPPAIPIRTIGPINYVTYTNYNGSKSLEGDEALEGEQVACSHKIRIHVPFANGRNFLNLQGNIVGDGWA